MSTTHVAAAEIRPSPPEYQSEILTVAEVADWLKMTKRQVYEMTRNRGQVRQDHPLPTLRINGNLRFRRSDIEGWLSRIAESGRVQ